MLNPSMFFVRATAVLSCALSAISALAAPPTAPSNLEAVASFPGDLAITLRWTDTSQNETGFEVQRSLDAGFEVFETVGVINLANVDSFNDVGLAEDTLYFYRVVAFNADGPSAFSNVAFDFTSFARPLQVSGLTGSFANGVTSLAWVDNANNETRFEVERAEIGVDTAFAVIAVLPPNTTQYGDSTALNGATYTYRITPYRYDVAGGAPETVTITTGAAIAGPTSVKSKATSKAEIELSWKGRFSGSSQIQIQRFDSNLGLWATIAMVPAQSGKFTDTGLARRTVYNYRLRTVSDTAVSAFVEAIATTR